KGRIVQRCSTLDLELPLLTFITFVIPTVTKVTMPQFILKKTNIHHKNTTTSVTTIPTTPFSSFLSNISGKIPVSTVTIIPTILFSLSFSNVSRKSLNPSVTIVPIRSVLGLVLTERAKGNYYDYASTHRSLEWITLPHLRHPWSGLRHLWANLSIRQWHNRSRRTK